MKIYVIAFLVGALGQSIWAQASNDLETRRMLRECKQDHAVYECVIKAVPVTQPYWVQNGESE